MKYKVFAGTCLVLIAFFIALSLYYKNQQVQMYSFIAQNNFSAFVRDHSQVVGEKDAKVFLIEFMDPACETCAAFFPLVKKMIAAYPGKIKHVIRYAPFHDGADYFVKILEAAKNQGKYWETLQVMFESQSFWASHHNPQPDKIWEFLPRAGLDLAQIKQDMIDPEIEKIIAQDRADANTLNVRKTPGFFVNGRPLVTFGAEQLHQLIKTEVEANY